MTFEDFQAYEKRQIKDVVVREKARLDLLQRPKPSKYRNQKVTIDGIKFDSKREGERYRQLKMMESVGKVSSLALQPSFELAPAVSMDGKMKRPLRYVADFSYIENGKIITEDVKGMKTDVYIIKKHLMKHIYGIDILET